MDYLSNPWYKKWWGMLLIFFSLIFFSLLVAVGLYFFSLVKKSAQELEVSSLLNNGAANIKYQVDDQGNYWLGATKPKLTIIEFADFACPFSKDSFPAIREISRKYLNEVRLVYKDYPLRDNSLALAMAGRCAGEQGLFWLMHDKLFQNQGISANDQLTALAYQIGANIAAFKDCLAKQKYLPQIQKDFTEAEKLRLGGTPSWFFNGYKVEGDVPYNTFMQIVDKFIK